MEAMTIEQAKEFLQKNGYEVRRKPEHVKAPFEIGDIIEPIEPDPNGRVYKVVGETACYMKIMILKGKLAGLDFNRRKCALARDWKRVE